MEGDSAWAGFGAEYLEVLRNEYPKTTIWTWGIESENVLLRTPSASNYRQNQRGS